MMWLLQHDVCNPLCIVNIPNVKPIILFSLVTELSAASKMTLEHQGGPMTSSEAAAFELNPRFEDILKMRTWDEQAKVKGMTLTPLIKYRNMFKSYMEAAL